MKRLLRRPDVFVETMVKRLFRNYLYPHLSELQRSGTVYFDSCAFISNLVKKDVPPESLDVFRHEYEKLTDELVLRAGITNKIFPEEYRSQVANTFIEYALVRLTEPKVVLETGVADGVSTYFLVNAIKNNGSGKILSVDVDKRAGVFLNENERSYWTFLLLRKPSPSSFKTLISSIKEVDIFVHDSDHSYKWQKLEYSSVKGKMKSGSILLSDDVDSSYAFIDTFQSIRKRDQISYCLGETRFFGGVII